MRVRVLPRVHGVVAQWVERRSYKAVVVSSILTNPTLQTRKFDMPYDAFNTEHKDAILEFMYWYQIAATNNLEYEFMISFLNCYTIEHDIYDSIAEAVCDWDLA